MANTYKGSVFSVCATAQPVDLDAAGFAALPWVAVGGVGTKGETGKITNVLNYDTLATDVSDKAKGVTNAGDPDVEMAADYADPGQIILKAQGNTSLKYAFKYELDDSPDGVLSNTIRYNRGLVLGPKHPNGANEDFVLAVYTLALVQAEIVVDPS